jgi:HD-GYP domain-containing protein (c-di-GMP phosphodiesterase class II)
MEALIQVMESTIAARDPYTVDHQRRVTGIACTLGREMGLSAERLRELEIAAMLHDLGKIAIPSGLLSKPGKLTTLEFALLKTHPEVAYNILKPIKLPGDTAEIILQHHERLNGSGYPHGLKGSEILLGARILGVADVMEAMGSHRPYRPSLGMAETLEELVTHQGVLYDAAVVQTCIKLYGLEGPLPQESCQRPTLEIIPPTATPEITPEASQPSLLTLPQDSQVKQRRWSKVFTRTHRVWLRLGTASLIGLFMLLAAIRGV